MIENKKQTELLLNLSRFANAKNPIDPDLLKKIPYFMTIFPEIEVQHALVRLSGEDGIAFIEHKTFKAGKKIISKGQFDQMIFWILAGEAMIVSEIKKQPKVVHRAHKGECIGELGVLRGAIRTADVIAGNKGVTVLELDWAITEKSPKLNKEFYHLIALNLADKLDCAYGKQIKIIDNSIKVLQEKTAHLIGQKRQMEKILKENGLYSEVEHEIDHEEVLSHAIANIKETLSFLEMKETLTNLDKFGAI